MGRLDPLEAAMLAGASSAPRERAERQARIAADGTTHGKRGVVIRTGEGAIAARLAEAFSQLADEFAADTSR
jgi:flagellar biosynthesis/type III secretory pathway protein FliH